MSDISAEQVEDILRFVSATPPVIHSRRAYNAPCRRFCKACEYERARLKALDACTLLRNMVDRGDFDGIPPN